MILMIAREDGTAENVRHKGLDQVQHLDFISPEGTGQSVARHGRAG